MDECEYNIGGLCSKQKIKLIVNRWDDIECEKSFEMVVAMVKGFHEEWSTADQTEPPEWHMSDRSLV